MNGYCGSCALMTGDGFRWLTIGYHPHVLPKPVLSAHSNGRRPWW